MGKTFRTAGWLAVVALLGAALVAPAAVFAGAGPEVEPTLHEGNIQGCPGDYLEFFFEDTDTESEGEVSVSLVYNSEDKSVDFEVTGGVAMIAFVKGGNAYNEYDYTGMDGVSEDDGLVAPDNESGGPAGLSHAYICVTATEEEETPTPTPTDEPEPTPTPTDKPDPTPTPTGDVQEETGTPEEEVTPPSTDTLVATGSSPSNTSWQLVLVATAALLATALILTPAQRRNRK